MSSPNPATLSAKAKSVLCIGALGVVFVDIGTSPLYTMRECVAHLPEGGRDAGVLGVLSLIFWSLTLVVSVKYLWYVMKADNQGEGGIFALLALIHSGRNENRPAGTAPSRRGLGPAVIMILIGAALLYGDGIITPAISVLGAAEGFDAISPSFAPFVAPMACVILAALFWIQHKGTKSIGGMFGPVMLVWFASLGALGLWYVAQFPGIWRALDPLYGLALLRHPPAQVTALLGSIVLAITGAEALYADMGHFGKRFIAIAWYGVAFPSLVLNYFGQGAYILTHRASAENPFFAMAPPGWPRAVLTGLSIAAAIIASQALISGAYSLTRQAIQLGYFPRLKINHTNPDQPGQIYIPFVNSVLAIGCIFTAAMFGSSDRLASAYGIAVTGTMAITTVAYFIVVRRNWRWPLWQAGPVCAVFLTIDLAFFLANARKLADGGWFPLAIAAAVLAVMHTWKSGREEIFQHVYGDNVTEAELAGIARSRHITRVPGTAVFMAGAPRGTPIALLHHIKANHCLHRTVILLSVLTEDTPAVSSERRLEVRDLGEGIWRAVGHYGYMQSPDVTEIMDRLRAGGLKVSAESAIYFFNREVVLYEGNSGMWRWEKSLYGFLSRNARPAKDYYRIAPSQIIEIGLPVHL
jgi:KUP system potassium uptake protein